jgi:hypothetical protein
MDSGRIDTSRLSGGHEYSGWIVYTALWCPLAPSLGQSPTELNMVRPPTRSQGLPPIIPHDDIYHTT